MSFDLFEELQELVGLDEGFEPLLEAAAPPQVVMGEPRLKRKKEDDTLQSVEVAQSPTSRAKRVTGQNNSKALLLLLLLSC